MNILLGLVIFLSAENYIGAERCGSCHAFAYQTWKASLHAKAHQALTPEQLTNTKCNTCHTTTVTLTGVQCERCHGSGNYYHPTYVMKDKELAGLLGLLDATTTCTQCHNEGAPSVVPFDFAKMWSRIDHSKAARLQWEALQKKK